jgi:hypothetical protein
VRNGNVSVRKALLAIALLAIRPLLPAQQTLSNDNVIKATKAGFSEDFIIATINRSPGDYDISADGLTALKHAGVSSKVVSAVVSKATVVTATPVAKSAPGPKVVPTTHASAAQSPGAAHDSVHPANKPRVFLESRSHSDLWNGNRNQSMEMSKDFGRDCPDVQISVNRTLADYTVSLNHIEHGLMRDNQIQIAYKDGDLVPDTMQGGSIKGDVKRACDLILVDWAKK